MELDEVSGGRVSNTWIIYLNDRDNSWKRLLIPDKLSNEERRPLEEAPALR